MSKSPRVPKYSLHKGTGQAVVKIKGRFIYLGQHGSTKSHKAYAQVISDFLAGREIRCPRSTAAAEPEPRQTLTLGQLITRYQAYTPTYYVKHGKPTSEVASINCALKFLPVAFMGLSVSEFKLDDLAATRQRMIDANLTRYSANKYIGRIKKMFSWAAEGGLIPPSISYELNVLTNLQPGRTTARETEPIRPIADSIVDQTLSEMPEVIAAMVELQRATGMRPDEVCQVRPCDIDRSQAVWEFKPVRHKTEHHNKVRQVFIGPQGQDILRPYLLRPEEEYCFRPSRGSATPRAIRRYRRDSYYQAIGRACDRAFPAPNSVTGKRLTEWKKQHRWAPNQLRHSYATEVRAKHGAEAAQVLLGHSNISTTEIYAEPNLEKGLLAVSRIG